MAMIYTPIIENIEKIGTPEQRAKWVKALRSGDYVQVKHILHNKNIPNSACCLGIACVVVSGKRLSTLAGLGIPESLFSDGFSVQAQHAKITKDQCRRLFKPAHLNDHIGMTFNQIADILEGKEVTL